MFKPENVHEFKIRLSKHFTLSWMRKWGWDINDVRSALETPYKLEKVGKYKYEAYIKQDKKSKKIILIVDEEYKEIFIITGAEGK